MWTPAKRSLEIARFFLERKLKGYTVSNDPWLDPEAAGWFEARLGKSRFYLEFGSGGSTRLSARLGIPTLTIESDSDFARAVRKGLAPGHRVTLIDPRIGLTGPWGVPVPGTPSPGRIRRWRNYIDRPFIAIRDGGLPFPDLVLVDGRFRRACALKTAFEASMAKAQTDLLFDDYFSEGRDHYHAVEAVLGTPERIGRAAYFRITGTEEVGMDALDEAIGDYR